jgi:phage tail sheath gpL-like
MTIGVNSIAAAVGSSVKNVQFTASATVLARKILLIGTYDPLLTAVVEDVPVQIFSPEDAAVKFGSGFMLHRLALQAFRGSNGVETWAVPQAETGVSTAADATIAFIFSGGGTTAETAGALALYIANERILVPIAKGDTATIMRDAAIAIINADDSLPVTAAVGTGDFDFKVTSKTKGDFWGNNITVARNLRVGDPHLPSNVILTFASKLVNGTGTPNISDALDSLGTGDDANAQFFTDVAHGYGQDVGTLDAISTYVGEGNEFSGLYDKLVGRPFRALTGDDGIFTAGLTDLLLLSNSRKLDRANGVIAVPGSASHPSEVAAQAIGHMARINTTRAEENYIGITLIDVDPGRADQRWTSDYDNRDLAVRSGVSPTKYKNGGLVLQNVVTFYHPDDLPLRSNGYLSMRNISILQNIIDNNRVNFEREKWRGFSIVSDTRKVTDRIDREKARDVGTVIDDLLLLARLFAGKAWLYSAEFTIERLKLPGAVEIRPGGTGFNSIFSVQLSGEGLILDTITEFDIDIAAGA